MNASHTFPKHERLKSKKALQQLFTKGSSLFVFPYKVFYLKSEEPQTTYPQVVFSVSKKNFKKSVDRHRVQRLSREAYRLNKALLMKEGVIVNNIQTIGFVFVGKELPEYKFVEKKLISLLGRLFNN